MKNTLTPDEVMITQMALHALIEDLEAANKDVSMPWTPEAREMNRDMVKNAKSAHTKFADASGALIKLDPLQDGDIEEFTTKES